MDKRQKLVVALLIVAIVFSLVSIGISISVSSPVEFRLIREKEDPVANVGITINEPVDGDVNGSG